MLARDSDGLVDVAYERPQPEPTLLYQPVEAHYPALVDQLVRQGKSLPDRVRQEFDAYFKCGRLEHGFLRVRCAASATSSGSGIFLQETRILSQLWRPPGGRDSGPASR